MGVEGYCQVVIALYRDDRIGANLFAARGLGIPAHELIAGPEQGAKAGAVLGAHLIGPGVGLMVCGAVGVEGNGNVHRGPVGV